jgi:ABC-2 type transport system ATP-binding protein
MKCELAAALIHRPTVLFSTSPPSGSTSRSGHHPQLHQGLQQAHRGDAILTSHYMDDVAALCPRVIVIDKGVLSYDGALDELARRVRPEKRLVLQLDSPVDRATLESLGRVVSVDAAGAVLQIPQELVASVVSRARATLPVGDLTVENAPLEEVMSELFAQSRAARPAVEDAA